MTSHPNSPWTGWGDMYVPILAGQAVSQKDDTTVVLLIAACHRSYLVVITRAVRLMGPHGYDAINSLDMCVSSSH